MTSDTPTRMSGVLSGGALQLGVRFFGLAAAAVIAPVLARRLGPESFGYLTLITAVAGLLVTIFDGGLGLLAGRDLPKLGSDHEITNWVSSFWRSRWISALAAAIACLALSRVPFAEPVRSGLVVIALAVPFQLVASAGQSLFLAQIQPGKAAVVELASRVVLLVGFGLVLMLKAGLEGWVAVLVLSQVAGVLVLYTLAVPDGLMTIKTRGGPWRLTGLEGSTRVLALIPVMGYIYTRADTLILAATRSTAELGLYGLLYRILDAPLGFLAVPAALVLPWLAGAGSDSQRNERYTLAAKALLALTSAAGFILTFAAGPLLQWLGGPAYSRISGGAGQSALVILFLMFGIMGLGTVNGSALIAHGDTRLILRHFGLAIVANLLLAALMIPRWGVVGGAVAALVAESAAVVHSGILLGRHTSMHPSKTIWLVISPAAAVGLARLGPPIFAAIATGLIVLFVVYLGRSATIPFFSEVRSFLARVRSQEPTEPDSANV